jgi:phosphoribosyl 1,2-cyclic phosphodiesterase
MITFSLQSGSNGNAIYVEADGTRLLFDAGISGKQAETRMALHDRDIRDVKALILSHDHADHVRCAGIYQRKFGIPIYVTPRTHRRIAPFLGAAPDVRYFDSGSTIAFGSVCVHTIRTPHDAVDGVMFVVESADTRLGILTDLGRPFAALADVLASVDAAYLESNHDAVMLAEGPYPQWLKNRVAGPNGHLSNDQAAALLQGCGRRRPTWVALSHLSEQNNEPDLALETIRRVVGGTYPVVVASRYEPSPVLEVWNQRGKSNG